MDSTAENTPNGRRATSRPSVTTASAPIADRRCTNCSKLDIYVAGNIKRCARCPGTLYCSIACQKYDWPTHKVTCGKPSNDTSNPTPARIPTPRSNGHSASFHAFNTLLMGGRDDFLHNIPEQEAMEKLIDCFRMRCEDEYVFGKLNVGIYAQEDPLTIFVKFLDLAETRQGILPPWWSEEKKYECVNLATTSRDFNIKLSVEKHDVQKQWRDDAMPAKLRLLGEKIYGRGFM